VNNFKSVAVGAGTGGFTVVMLFFKRTPGRDY
jgi:predicted rRNA methylase YqxC with S4 and FtsJ domains